MAYGANPAVQSILVSPIRPGFSFSQVIVFSPECPWSALGFSLLEASKVMAQFRGGPARGADLLATADTLNQGVVVIGADTLRLSISSSSTRLFPPGKPAWMDFAILLGDAWRYIPALIPWPVVDTVTDPPEAP